MRCLKRMLILLLANMVANTGAEWAVHFRL
jgi:hypothetical protein